jgi:hypothetical protein
MERRRAERVVWAISGVALGIALVLFVQNRQDRLTVLFIVISLGVSLVFEVALRVASGRGPGSPRG